MHRAILESCLPCFVALMVAFVAIIGLVRLSGARWDLRRLRSLHSCEDGGVQSLSFVIALPMFLMVVMFIVQVSQLMIGLMVVNYAAFAAARSATVWIPAAVTPYSANKLPPPITEETEVVLFGDGPHLSENYKYQKVFSAAVLALAPVAPSRDLGIETPAAQQEFTNAANAFYRAMAPQFSLNPRIARRIENKLAYSYANTAVRIEFVDKDSHIGPTYNPRALTNDDSETREWDPHEVGWQDPVTVTVSHNFALLPGPGRFLARQLVRADERPDEISPRIDSQTVGQRERIYTTLIWASATMTNEGFQSLVPYVQDVF